VCDSLSDVSVVISVFSIERADNVVACIESLKKQTLPPKEVVVVLDPDSVLVSYYEGRLGSSVRLVVSDGFGLSAARNVGVKSCGSEFIAFIDDDAVADRDWLRCLVSSFVDSLVIGVGGRVVPVWPGQRPGWFPEELYWVIGCSYKGLPMKKASVRNPIGCNMAFRRSVFERVGLFNTNIGRVGNVLLGHDDTEFGIRATSKLLGSTIIYDPQAVVYHRVSSNRVSFNYVVRRSYFEGFSKAFLSKSSSINKDNLGIEKNYLRFLLLSTPQMLLRGNVKTGFSRCWTLWVATAMVFLGYIIGSKSV